VDKNLSRLKDLIEKTVREGARLVVLPEMFNVGFYLGEDLMTVAETLNGKTVSWLKNQAARHNIYITGSIYERFEGHFYNTMVMVGSDGSLQHYRKRNPTLTEMIAWRRSSTPGPGIFETPFGRIGGVICFDSFARETFEGFQKNAVDLVIIIALWGTFRLVARHPETRMMRALFQRWSNLASEAVPLKYATELKVPAVFVNQGGKTHFHLQPAPRLWPLPPPRDLVYDYWGSRVRDASGRLLIQAGDNETAYCTVVPLKIRSNKKSPQITKADIPPDYLSADYYFVQPPFLAKLFQRYCLWGYNKEYEARRLRHS
jgi:predicted amidohydrolase